MGRAKFSNPKTWFINPEQLYENNKRPTLASFEKQVGSKGVFVDTWNFDDGTHGYRYRFSSVVVPCQMCGELTKFHSGTVVVDDDGKIFHLDFLCQNCQAQEYLEERNRLRDMSPADYADLKLDMLPDIPAENKSNRFLNFNSKIVSGATLAINELKNLTAGYGSSESNRIVVITGKTGRGKTHLAVAAIWDYFLQNSTKGATYTSFANFTSLFRDKSSNKNYKSDLIALYSTSLLVIDSVSIKKVSSFFIDEFNELIKYRIDNKLKTIIAGDISTEDLSALFNQECISRVKASGKIITLAGEDYRQTKGASTR